VPWQTSQGQVPRAVARDRLFPASFARLSRGGTPWVGLVVSSALITMLMAANYTRGLVELFTYTLRIATLTTLIPYAYSAMAQLMLFVKDRERFQGRRLMKDSIIACLAFAYSVWAISGAGQEVVFFGMLLLLAGIPVYVWLRWRGGTPEPAVPIEEPVEPKVLMPA
jgi:basic amino acid/polyamine antiporter, APA family